MSEVLFTDTLVVWTQNVMHTSGSCRFNEQIFKKVSFCCFHIIGFWLIDLAFISAYSFRALDEARILSLERLPTIKICSNSSTLLNITWAWASLKTELMSRATFNGFGIVCPWILCAVTA